jgi:hypothetical protein
VQSTHASFLGSIDVPYQHAHPGTQSAPIFVMQEAVTSRTKPSLMKLVAKKVKEKESLGLYESSVDIENAVNIDYGANPHWKRGHRCWEAKGEAAQQYKSMESSLLNELNQSRKESFCEVCISLFMIGKSPRHAKPIILISSEDKRSRQEAKAALDSSGILEDTGFKIGVLKYLPSGPIHPVASIRDGSLDGTALYRSPSSSSSSEPTPSALSSNFAYYNLNRDLQAIGMPIYVKTDENVVRMATANLLYNGKGYGYMTAAHIFDGWTKASSNKDDGEGDLVDGIPFDSDSDTDGDFYDEEYIPTPQNLRSTKAVSSKPQASRVHGTWLGKSQGASSETFLVDDEARSELVVLGRVSTSQKDLDFAIITVNDSKLEKQLDNLTSSGDRQHDRLSATKPFPSKVTAFTTHGPVDGASFHVPTLIRLPGSDRYRSLYGFTYEGSIEVGDCGSLVFSKDSRSLYGMIIAASDKEPIAYVVAGDQIVQSIAEVGQWRMLHMDRDPNNSSKSSDTTRAESSKETKVANRSTYGVLSPRNLLETAGIAAPQQKSSTTTTLLDTSATPAPQPKYTPTASLQQSTTSTTRAHYGPWTWSAPHHSHYSHLLADDGFTVLDTVWSGPATGFATSQIPAAGQSYDDRVRSSGQLHRSMGSDYDTITGRTDSYQQQQYGYGTAAYGSLSPQSYISAQAPMTTGLGGSPYPQQSYEAQTSYSFTPSSPRQSQQTTQSGATGYPSQYPGPRRSVTSLPVDVQSTIQGKDRRYIQTNLNDSSDHEQLDTSKRRDARVTQHILTYTRVSASCAVVACGVLYQWPGKYNSPTDATMLLTKRS